MCLRPPGILILVRLRVFKRSWGSTHDPLPPPHLPGGVPPNPSPPTSLSIQSWGVGWELCLAYTPPAFGNFLGEGAGVPCLSTPPGDPPKSGRLEAFYPKNFWHFAQKPIPPGRGGGREARTAHFFFENWRNHKHGKAWCRGCPPTPTTQSSRAAPPVPPAIIPSGVGLQPSAKLKPGLPAAGGGGLLRGWGQVHRLPGPLQLERPRAARLLVPQS